MKKLALIAVVALGLTGCASIINEKTQNVNVTTSNGAKISGKVNGQDFSAPGVVPLLRENKSKIFETSAAGCVPQTSVEKTVDPIFFINIFSGAYGSTTDYATEKMWKYSENIVINCK
jgi:uncharacterized protein YceK